MPPRGAHQLSNTKRNKIVAITAFVIAFVVALVGATRLQVSDDAAEAMLPTDPATVARYADFLDRFPSDQGALVVFENLLCHEEGWALIQRADRAFRKHPLIDRTVSLASPSSRYIVANGDEVDLSRFADAEFPTPQARCEAATMYAPFRNTLVSADGYATAMYLIAAGDEDATSFSEQLLAIYQPFADEATQMGGRVVITGEAVMSAELSRVVAQDSLLIGGVIIVMLILVFAVTRAISTTLVSGALNVFVLVFSYGVMGWLGIQLTPSTSLVVFLLVPLSSAFVIHAHGYVVRNTAPCIVPVEARVPCILAGVSTAIGFACTGLTPAPDIQALALMGVIGIAAGTMGVFLFVFPVLSSMKDLKFAVAFNVPRWPILRPGISLMMLALFALIAVTGLLRLDVQYEPSNYLPLSNPARADFEEAGQWFGRMNLPLVVYTDNTEDPEPWIALKPLIDELYKKYPTGFQATWFYDHMAEVSQAFTSDGESEVEGFPSDSETFSQLLLWFDPEDLELYMDDEREQYVVLLQIPYIGSRDYYEMKTIVDQYLVANHIDGRFVGRVSSFFETGHRIGADNLKGLALGGVLVFLLLLVLFRSLPMALIGIFINGLPVLTSLGVLGLLGVPIDMGSSMVTAMAFGIVLDDSTHLLVRVQQLLKSAYDPSTAVLRAVREMIAPIMTTTLVICVGFVILLGAEVRMFHDFAMLILATMFAALIADIVILPALVRRFIKDPLSEPFAARSS